MDMDIDKNVYLVFQETCRDYPFKIYGVFESKDNADKCLIKTSLLSYSSVIDSEMDVCMIVIPFDTQFTFDQSYPDKVIAKMSFPQIAYNHLRNDWDTIVDTIINEYPKTDTCKRLLKFNDDLVEYTRVKKETEKLKAKIHWINIEMARLRLHGSGKTRLLLQQKNEIEELENKIQEYNCRPKPSFKTFF